MTGQFGRSVPRVEDDALLRGAGRYVDDLDAGDHCYQAAFLRSDQAHADIVSVDTRLAGQAPGVLAVLEGRQLSIDVGPMVFDIARMVPDSLRRSADVETRVHPMPALPADRVTYVGQPYVMVVARTRYQAEDALELVEAVLDPRPAVIDPAEALASADVLVEPRWTDNVALRCDVAKGDTAAAFAAADVVVSETFRSHRYIASPIETRGVLASAPAADGSQTVWSSTQVPHQLRDFLTGALGRAPGSLQVVAPDVGGGFGVKGSLYPEELLVTYAAARFGVPVKWIEDRAEHFAATTHGREQTHRIELAADAEGRVLAVRDAILHNCGAYHTLGLVVPYNSITHLLGPYDIGSAEISVRAVLTNTGVVAPYRGAGRPEAVFAMERAMDRLARALRLDPVEVRRRNLISPESMPYATGLVYRDGTDQVYDSGDYPALLDKAVELTDEAGWRAVPGNPSGADERYRIGIGYAAYVEGTGVGPFEAAEVELADAGKIIIRTGSASQGQGHRTTFAQIAADTLGVRLEDVEVVGGDTRSLAAGFGTIASRSIVVGGNATRAAGLSLRRRILDVAADVLEAAAADLDLADSVVVVKGDPDVGLTLADLAGALSPYNPARPPGVPVSLRESAIYRPGPVTYAAGVHAAVVRVDTVTGKVELLRYSIAHDCGRTVNPMIAEGQILGGVMQGIGGALHEELTYDEDGQLVTSSFLDYLLPTADAAPEFRIAHVDAASPLNPLGIKGLGEGGAIGPPAAIANAVEDALRGYGAVVRATPLTPGRVRDLVRENSDCERYADRIQ